MPFPPSRKSSPPRPASRSSPSPPSNRLAPASPRMMSLPRPPSTFSMLISVSLPASAPLAVPATRSTVTPSVSCALPAVSVPFPPSRRSSPARPRSVSSPSPPSKMSESDPPSSRSCPMPPERTSIPAPPISVSLPPPPSMTSLPALPLTTSSPFPARMRSLLLVPESVSAAFVPTIIAMFTSPDFKTEHPSPLCSYRESMTLRQSAVVTRYLLQSASFGGCLGWGSRLALLRLMTPLFNARHHHRRVRGELGYELCWFGLRRACDLSCVDRKIPEVTLDHFDNQLVERHPVLPAELALCLARIAEQAIDLGRPEIVRIDLDQRIAALFID